MKMLAVNSFTPLVYCFLRYFGADIVLFNALDLFDNWLLCRLHAASEPKDHICQ